MSNSTQGDHAQETAATFTYDDWGRTASQTVGSKSATYSYKYGSKLASVSSTLFGEANVTFEYGGDQRRRSMTTGGVTKQYNWDMAWNVINEEDGNGALVRSYTHNPLYPLRATLAHVDGTSPATGDYRYYLHDHLGSTRFIFDDEVNLLATYQYTPYGDILSSNNPNTTTHLFTGHDWNPASNLYFAPFRYYSPQTARWLVRDPLGIVDGPNVYAYVGCTPLQKADAFGLIGIIDIICSLLPFLWFCPDDDPNESQTENTAKTIGSAIETAAGVGVPGPLAPVVDGFLNPDTARTILEVERYSNRLNDAFDESCEH